MKQRNICKFVSSSAETALDVRNFVHETDRSVMAMGTRLDLNRAILVCDGRGEARFDTHSVTLSRGDLVFGFEEEHFSAIGDEAFQYMYISFAGERAKNLFTRFGINSELRKKDGLDGIIPLWQESLTRASDENIDLSAESILLYTFSRLSRSEAKTSNIISEVISLSEECFNEQSLSVSVVAERLGYNPKYISHVFKEKVGRTYSEYLRSLRIKYAISLFDHGIDSVKNVALLSGFGDSLYFSSVFKKEIGLSPTQYIEQKQNKDS